MIDETLKQARNVLIIGLGEIGAELVKLLASSYSHLEIYGINRSKVDLKQLTQFWNFNPSEKNQWDKFSQEIQKRKYDLVISTVGILHDKTIDMLPEKKLSDIEAKKLEYSMKVNLYSHIYAIQCLQDCLPTDRIGIIAILSAKVGSITDNGIGGWYSYRITKAALNMLIKTSAIEINRKNRHGHVVALHPGTTKSSLSAPYIQKTNLKVWDAADTAKHLLETLDTIKIGEVNEFLNWNGERIPW